MRKRHPDVILRLIALLKLAKALVLISVGIGALALLHAPDGALAAWIDALVFDPHFRYLHAVLARVRALNDHKLELISAASLAYAALFIVEGAGLLARRAWAEVMTVVVTASFIPLEIYELVDHPSAAKPVVIVINLLVVLYLLRRLHQEQHWPFHRPRA
jgi:uncharacterized membrane protein (DUF2068 family)